MRGFNPELLKQGQQATSRALNERNAVAATIAAQSAQIATLEDQIASMSRAGEIQQAGQLRAQADQLRANRAVQHKRFQEIDQAWQAAVGQFILNLDPCDADPALPLLLLPVRLETRYTPDGKTLRIRIFPDEVHMDRLNRRLSDAEQVAGREYWNAVWRKPELDPALDIAWRALVSAAGISRAA